MILPRGVGIVGRKRSGKDSIAATLVTEFGYDRVALADPLKEMALALDPIAIPGTRVRLAALVREVGWEAAKDGWPEVRRILQRLGTDAARATFGADVWVRLCVERARDSRRVVVPDVRFPNEATGLRAHGFVIVRVDRPDVDQVDPHPSETELDRIEPDHRIVNDSTLDTLAERVRYLVRNLP